MKVICKDDGKNLPNYLVNKYRRYITIGKSYEVLCEGIFKHNNEPFYEIVSDYNDIKITVSQSQFKTPQEVREEKLNLLNI